MKRIPIIILLVVALATGVYAKIDFSNFYQESRDYSLEQLNRLSYDCLMRGELDSAIVYSLMVVNRQPLRITAYDAKAMLAAYVDLGAVYFMRSDLGKAQEMYLNALYLSDKYHIDSRELIENNLANFYVEAGLPEKAIERYIDALGTATEKGNWRIAFICYANLLEVATLNDLLDMADSCLLTLDAAAVPDTLAGAPYICAVSESYRRLKDGDNAAAAATLLASPSTLRDPVSSQRLSISAIVTASKMLIDSGLNTKAIALLDSARTLSVAEGMHDNTLVVDRLLSQAHKALGNDHLAREHRLKALEMTDSLLSGRIVSQLTQSMDDLELTRLNNTIVRMEQRRKSLITTIVTITVALAVISLLFVSIYRQRAELNRNNRLLYSRNMDLIEREKELMNALAGSTKPKETPTKYQGSSLNETHKRAIAAKIRRVMVESDEIYSTDFSAERLAELMGEPFKKVSQVINEVYGVNFNALLNEYRIKEACRRISDFKTYGDLTLEAICNGVGFKSRSGFTKIFKQETGMLPSVFLKIAKEKETCVTTGDTDS